LYTSSANPEELSLTIRGLLLGIVPLLSVAFEVPEGLLTNFVEGMIGLIASGMVAYGLTRKLIIAFKK